MAGLFSDTKICKDDVEHLLHMHPPSDRCQVGYCLAEFFRSHVWCLSYHTEAVQGGTAPFHMPSVPRPRYEQRILQISTFEAIASSCVKSLHRLFHALSCFTRQWTHTNISKPQLHILCDF
mmetsp:Transcript_18772/g.43312  ORF Transcript_18772/g.43312 Transcript_18772/m.43312 type:complete len:121 (-) Transcript_18772:973-1335(-)